MSIDVNSGIKQIKNSKSQTHVKLNSQRGKISYFFTLTLHSDNCQISFYVRLSFLPYFSKFQTKNLKINLTKLVYRRRTASGKQPFLKLTFFTLTFTRKFEALRFQKLKLRNYYNKIFYFLLKILKSLFQFLSCHTVIFICNGAKTFI